MSLHYRLLVVVICLASFSRVCADDDGPDPRAISHQTFNVDFNGTGNLQLVLEEAKLELETPYGSLSIPPGHITRILLATRISSEEQKEVDNAIFNLGSADFAQRSEAEEVLRRLGVKAYPALLKATKHADLEVAQRAKDIAAKLRSELTEEELAIRAHDVIETETARFEGHLKAEHFSVKTSQFGKQQLPLFELRSLTNTRVVESAVTALEALPDPGHLFTFNGRIGETLAFKVTGRVDGTVYGTGVYTTDSNLATAAVHCGALKVGETGTVRVTIMPSPPAFASTAQNGVTSSAWGPYPAAYQVHVPKKK